MYSQVPYLTYRIGPYESLLWDNQFPHPIAMEELKNTFAQLSPLEGRPVHPAALGPAVLGPAALGTAAVLGPAALGTAAVLGPAELGPSAVLGPVEVAIQDPSLDNAKDLSYA